MVEIRNGNELCGDVRENGNELCEEEEWERKRGGGNRKRQNMERWRGMYVGMGMSFVGRRNEKGNGEGGIRKGRTWNGENGLCWEGGIGKAEQGIGMTEHGMAEISWKHYSNKRNYMQDSSLNTTPSIQKYNLIISVILIYYYTLYKGRWTSGEM
jgi:hypothetical protein